MHCFKSICLTAAALAASVAQAVQFTNSDYSGITAGQPFEISWSGDGTVSYLEGSGQELRILADPTIN